MSKPELILQDNTLSVVMPDKLDITNSQEVLDIIQNTLAQKKVEKIIFDMQHCDYISSAGIGILANITRQAKEKNIKTKLSNYSETIKQILVVTDILKYIGTE